MHTPNTQRKITQERVSRRVARGWDEGGGLPLPNLNKFSLPQIEKFFGAML